jgi:hypothetical protein
MLHLVLRFYLQHCFSNWFPRNSSLPLRGVRVSERRKCVMAEEFYWQFEICMYKLNFAWRHSTLIIPSLIARRQCIAASTQKFPDSKGTHGQRVICLEALNGVPLTPAKPLRHLPTNQDEYRGKNGGISSTLFGRIK